MKMISIHKSVMCKIKNKHIDWKKLFALKFQFSQSMFRILNPKLGTQLTKIDRPQRLHNIDFVLKFIMWKSIIHIK